eukprot:CAMPEP_0196579726 /NCGR_PEP_ID=MMETSP1081-20130531/24479_1 /TAXON_ID=36882 /ORGANISM="Pyramimonas amylifera, Strain CCMP720" /LENGTH=178 /DNA_ID=CAMNT_0041899391 /DNA_START=170 /DNA_END=706 /DNA_ORIENTATION=+
MGGRMERASPGGAEFSATERIRHERRKPRRAPTHCELQEIMKAFRTFDPDNRGFLEYREFKVAMRALGFDGKKSAVLEILEDYDKDQEDTVSEQEFIEIISKQIADLDGGARMERAFELFDDDHSGKISVKNLKRVARDMGEMLHEDEIRAMIDEFDQNGDGEIDQREFFAIMRYDAS